MAICELCGAETGETLRVKLEGSILQVCPNCAKYGEVVDIYKPAPVQKEEDSEVEEYTPTPVRKVVTPHYQKKLEEDDSDVADDYPQRIQRARQQMGLKQDEFAKKLNERESVVKHLESGKLYPDEKLLKKLEKVLGVSLREEE